MIGNDLVDLGDAEAQPGATHARFDARVFAREERDTLCASESPNRLRWIFWASKEAAYKVARKLDSGLVFSPGRMLVRLGSNLSGEVLVAERHLFLRVDEDHRRIHALVRTRPFADEGFRSHVATLPEGRVEGEYADPRRAVRAFLSAGVSEALGAAPEDLSVESEGRVPVLYHKGERVPLDLSLSHHGRFVAWACDAAAEARP